MQLLSRTNNLCALFSSVAISTLAIAGFEQSAFAQEAASDTAAQSSSDVPAGHIIYSRTVPYGSAIGPRMPGEAHTVNAGPTAVIIGSLTTGLEPISDDENASIAAGPNLYAGRIDGQISQGLSALSSMDGAGNSANNVAGVQASATGGAIGSATGAIGSAMGSLRGALSGNLTGSTGGGQ